MTKQYCMVTEIMSRQLSIFVIRKYRAKHLIVQHHSNSLQYTVYIPMSIEQQNRQQWQISNVTY